MNTPSKRNRIRPQIEALEARELLASIIALTTDNHLLRFDSASPTKILRDSLITGVAAGDTLDSLTIRPETGQLFGLSDQSRFYGISTRSASATQVGPQLSPLLTGNSGNIVVNPVSDQADLITNSGQNFLINPATGASTLLPALPSTLRVAAIAYTNNNPGATSTQLYGIDYVSNNLIALPDPSQGTVSAVPTVVGPLNVNVLSPEVGLTIAPDGTAYAALRNSAGFELYTVNLTTGAASPVQLIGDGTQEIKSLAVERPATAYALSTSGALVSFLTDSPDQITTLAPAITGLGAGETLQTLSFDPASGLLFGVSSAGQEYTLNLGPSGTVGAATKVGTATAISGSATGTFDPITDTYRVITSNEQSLEYSPSTGSVVRNPDASYSFGDVNGLFAPSIAALAADNPLNGASSTTIFGIDPVRNTLVTIGTAADDNGNYIVPPTSGQVNTVGPLGVVVSDPQNVAFAINTKNDAFAVLTTNVNGVVAPRLYRVNLSTGAAAFAGTLGGGTQLTTLAMAQPGVISFGTISPVSEPAVGGAPASAVITINRSFGDTSNTADIVFSTAPGGTAVAGTNYTATKQTLTFGVGEYSKTVTVPILNDNVATGPLTVDLTLSRLPGSLSRLAGVLVGGKANAMLTINNTGGVVTTPPVQTKPGTLAFAASTGSFVDTTGFATVTVSRTAGLDGTVTVGYATVAGSAVAGSNFSPVSGTLTFGPNVASQSFQVPLLINQDSASPTAFNIVLSAPKGGATLGPVTTQAITIVPAVQSVAPHVLKSGRIDALNVVFGVSVDATAAAKLTSYVLTVTGQKVHVTKSTYNSSTHTVTLKLSRRISPTSSIHLQILGTRSGGPLPGASESRTVAVSRHDQASAPLIDPRGLMGRGSQTGRNAHFGKIMVF